MRKTILVIAAHPDDEVIGCGGTLARLSGEGSKISTLILGEGKTSRHAFGKKSYQKSKLRLLKKEAVRANALLGVKEILFYDLPDNRFDTIPLLDIIKKIEDVKARIKPDVVFTHYRNDLNIDHRITYQAAITAFRPISGEIARELYSFEVLSSTEWNYPTTFSPNTFFDIAKTLNIKLEAMSSYRSELGNSRHPRSLEAINNNASYWGFKSGLKYAEAFEAIRMMR